MGHLRLGLMAGLAVVLATLPASVYGLPAQQPAAAQPPPTRLILLGTGGGPLVRKLRSEPSSLLVVGGRRYLIDAGAGAQRQLSWAGYRPVDLDAIFITHHHLDHNAEVVTLISSSWVEGRKAPLPIVGPPGTKSLVKAALDYFSASERLYGGLRQGTTAAQQVAPLDIERPGVVFDDGVVKVTAVVNSHYSTFEPGADRSYSYRFDTPGRSVVFSGDTGPSEALRQLAQGADVLVSEVIDIDATIIAASRDAGVAPDPNSPLAAHMREEHLSPEEVGKLAAAAKVKMVVLSHITPGLDDEVDMTRYSQGVRRYYSGPVVVGRDLQEF